METTVRAHVLVQGRVQGVAYRAFAYHEASHQGLHGWVRNLADGRVEIEVEGNQTSVESFVDLLKKGPPLARVDSVKVEWLDRTRGVGGFEILH